ncbi:MAG: lysophospholipid acyltransferase family protein [Candidatus Krumholzibacteria bacterium]|nr:lysophospholipid acyltransferase family protein [Candidatus Krumholzibacteria bacterium]
MNLGMKLMAIAAATLIRALGLTWRVTWDGLEREAAARAISPRVIYAAWHGRLLPLAWTHRGRALHILASEHRDGERLGQVIRRLGFGHVRGSSTRGGARGLRDMAARLRDGLDVGITVDGPRGPRHRVKPGSLEIAKIAGAAIVPITASSRRHKILASWDAFEIPLPFTRVRVAHGAPVTVPADASPEVLEAKRQELERTLHAITEENDRLVRADR